MVARILVLVRSFVGHGCVLDGNVNKIKISLKASNFIILAPHQNFTM